MLFYHNKEKNLWTNTVSEQAQMVDFSDKDIKTVISTIFYTFMNVEERLSR